MALPISCTGCPLSTNPACGRFTSVEGKGGFGVLIVGEASGEAEASEGLPFRPSAPAGSVLDKAIRRQGWTRDQFWITNVVRCRPPRNWLEGAPWQDDAIAHCRSNLDEVIARLKPRAIVTLGSVPTRELTGLSGPKQTITYLRGYTLPSRYGVPVIPAFHPSFLARGKMSYLGMLMQDLARAVTVAQQGLSAVTDHASVVRCETSLEALIDLYHQARQDPELLIAYDLETTSSAGEDEDKILEFSRDDAVEDSDSEEVEEPELDSSALDTSRASIRTVQFAIAPDWGVEVPWQPGFIEVARDILALPNPKAAHNGWLFDSPILARHGAPVTGRNDDTLWMFHAIQPELPANLQAVTSFYAPDLPPWKHLAASSATIYGVYDVIAVWRIMQRLPADLGRKSLWKGYDELTLGFRPVLESMERRGIPVSPSRLRELRQWLNEEIARMQLQIVEAIPRELLPLAPKGGYKTLPADVKDVAREIAVELGLPVTGTKALKLADLDALVRADADRIARVVAATGCELRPIDGVDRWVRPQPFNVRSSPQLLAYLKFKKYPIPTKFKDGKETTGDKELERLAAKTKDPVLTLVREIRATSKLRDSYTGKDGEALGGWNPGADGRLRATFTFATANWQLAARNPNVLTLPKRRKDLARRFRSTLAAEPGHQMVELDMRAFHARTLGLEAADADYMRLADLDIHSFVAGHLVKWPGIETCLTLPDDDLRAFLGEIKAAHKAVRDFKAKPTILGVGFGMGARRLYFENRDSLKGEAEARALLQLLRDLFPKVFRWQEEVVDLADRQGYLISRWGAIRWFWDVYTWRRDSFGQWQKAGSKDAEKAKSFLPANDAHGMLRFKILEMERRGWNDRYGLINIVHDAVWFHCPTPLVDECLSEVSQWLMAPVPQLAHPDVCPEGFTCAVEATVGPSLGEMEEVKLC